MTEIVTTTLLALFLYFCWLWLLAGVHWNRLDRGGYSPSTGGAWVRPRGRYEDLPH